MVDLYPSRVSNTPEITERKDPVLYTDPHTDAGPLTTEQLHSYEKNGFLFLKQFFSEEEVQQVNKELFRLMEENRDSDAEEVIREPVGDDIRSIFDVHQNDHYFERLSSDSRLVDIVHQLLGSDVYIHQSRINFKPGFNGKEFDWHSDFETWHVEDGMPRMRAVSCSITLTDNFSFNGPLMLIPGSHDYYVSCIGETPDAHYQQSLKKQKFGVPDQESLTWLVERGGITVPTGPAGSVIFFECNTMHGSNSNITPMPRNNVFMVYNSVENKVVKPFGNLEPRPDFLGKRDAVPVLS